MQRVGRTSRVLPVGGFGTALAVGGLVTLSGCGPPLPAEPAKAVVTAIYPEPRSSKSLPTVQVEARTPDGRIATMSVPANQLRCRLGDVIRAERRGVSIGLEQSDCASLGTYG